MDDNEIVNNNRNYLITGHGGVGKSFRLNNIYDLFIKKNLNCHKSSSTGLSARNIGGTTVHSILGIGIGKHKAETIVSKLYKFDIDTINRIKEMDCLEIDEISMLSGEQFDLADSVCRIIRNNDNPFGGIKLILFGDFLQLPPVNGSFIFRSKAWDQLNLCNIQLKTPYRFTNKEYYYMLGRIREGKQTKEDIDKLIERIYYYKLMITPKDIRLKKYSKYLYPYISKDIISNVLIGYLDEDEEKQIKPTVLFCRKDDVEEMNMSELKKLKGDIITYRAEYIYSKRCNMKYYEKIIKNLAIEYVYLKVGAQVMLTSNLDVKSGLTNGSRGIIKRLHEDSVDISFIDPLTKNTFDTNIGMFEYLYSDKHVNIKAYQLPLILAWSLTIHKVQGSTLDSAIIDLSNVFEYSLIYTALSRLRSLDSLYLKGLDLKWMKPNPIALKFEYELNKLN